MKKSPEAFRTISEVSEWLDTPAHVLRFWESRFSQVKPVKRAGGRRYYRPADMRLLGGIKKLLHDDGVTIRGVQKILREQGVKYVAGLSPPLAGDDAAGPAAEEPEAAPAAEARPGPGPAPDTAAPAPPPAAQPAAQPERGEAAPPPPPPEGPAPDLPGFVKRVETSGRALRRLDGESRARVTALYDRLKALRDRMSSDIPDV